MKMPDATSIRRFKELKFAMAIESSRRTCGCGAMAKSIRSSSMSVALTV
jgi:hypothetical protein